MKFALGLALQAANGHSHGVAVSCVFFFFSQAHGATCVARPGAGGDERAGWVGRAGGGIQGGAGFRFRLSRKEVVLEAIILEYPFRLVRETVSTTDIFGNPPLVLTQIYMSW